MILEGLKKFEQYLSLEKRYSKHTITAYKKDIVQFYTFLSEISEGLLIANIKFHHVRSWIVSLAQNGVANRSINRKITSIRSFFKFLRSKNIVSINPCDKVTALKIPKRLPQFVKQAELLNLYDLILDEETFEKRRDFTILELLYNTGIRKTELINLQVDDIVISSNFIKVLGKGNKERIVPISNELLENLRIYIEFRNKLKIINDHNVFLSVKGNKLYPKAVYNIVNKYLSLLTTVERKSPHTLRHSFATHLMNEGAELNAVKELLGHSSLAATQVYTHNSIQTLKDIYKKTHPKGA